LDSGTFTASLTAANISFRGFPLAVFNTGTTALNISIPPRINAFAILKTNTGTPGPLRATKRFTGTFSFFFCFFAVRIYMVLVKGGMKWQVFSLTITVIQTMLLVIYVVDYLLMTTMLGILSFLLVVY
jgi:hypothetical protein